MRDRIGMIPFVLSALKMAPPELLMGRPRRRKPSRQKVVAGYVKEGRNKVAPELMAPVMTCQQIRAGERRAAKLARRSA